MMTALFIDLPNFYSHLLKSGIDEPRVLRDYFLYWLDFDLLAKALTDSFSGIWIFYSGGRIGPSDERIEGQYLKEYIDRINALQGVTARDVNIPGEQREPATFQCRSCGQENVVEWKSEKGIDASLAVYLFDTMDSWDVAYLLSGDADYVPAVASLRRRGKIAIGAGFPDASSTALVRECYDYIDLCDLFLKEGVAAYSIFKRGGIAERWLTDEVLPRPGYSSAESLKLSVDWQPYYERFDEPGHVSVRLSADKLCDFSHRRQQIEEFQARWPDILLETEPEEGRYSFSISRLVWCSVERRLDKFTSSIEGLRIHDPPRRYSLEYKYNHDADEYTLVAD